MDVQEFRYIKILKSMWNTMECETYWERISYARNSFVLQTSATFSTYDHRGSLKLIMIIMN